MEAYTDGACSRNGAADAWGGAAWIILKNGEIIHIDSVAIPNATNNIAELVALIRACKYLEEINNGPLKEECFIYSDSAYCIDSYKQGWVDRWSNNGWVTTKRTPVKNKELWEELYRYFKMPHLHFEKIKGHAGHKYQEMADTLAVTARLKGEMIIDVRNNHTSI